MAIMIGVLLSICAFCSVSIGQETTIEDAKIGQRSNTTAKLLLPIVNMGTSSDTRVNILSKRVGRQTTNLKTITPRQPSSFGNFSETNKDMDFKVNQTDMNSAESRSRYRVSHVTPEYRHHHHHHRHEHSPPKYVETNEKPRGYQDVSEASEEPSPVSKEDPDYGQHYDSNGHRYDFGYDVKDKEGALTFRKETGDAKSLKGSYGIRDVDGRLRIVRYVADDKGFRAKVETNEPGTGSEDAANVYFNGYDAEKIPSHDVVHKDRGQHSFKQGRYNSHIPLDSGLREGTVAVEDPAQEDSGKYQYQYDQIPMEINPTQERHVSLAGSSLDSHGIDKGAASQDHYYKEQPHPNSPRFRYSPPHRYPNGPIFADYHQKKRIDGSMVRYQRIPDLPYTIPYNTLTGFYEDKYF